MSMYRDSIKKKETDIYEGLITKYWLSRLNEKKIGLYFELDDKSKTNHFIHIDSNLFQTFFSILMKAVSTDSKVKVSIQRPGRGLGMIDELRIIKDAV